MCYLLKLVAFFMVFESCIVPVLEVTACRFLFEDNSSAAKNPKKVSIIGDVSTPG